MHLSLSGVGAVRIWKFSFSDWAFGIGAVLYTIFVDTPIRQQWNTFTVFSCRGRTQAVCHISTPHQISRITHSANEFPEGNIINFFSEFQH